jgi:hypothetical protein
MRNCSEVTKILKSLKEDVDFIDERIVDAMAVMRPATEIHVAEYVGRMRGIRVRLIDLTKEVSSAPVVCDCGNAIRMPAEFDENLNRVWN